MVTRHFIFKVLLFIFIKSANGQHGNFLAGLSYPEKYIRQDFNLKSSDTIMRYRTFQTYSSFGQDSCHYFSTDYILYTKKKKVFFTIFNECFEYDHLEVDRTFLSFFYAKKDSLLKSKIEESRCFADDVGIKAFEVFDKGNKFWIVFPTYYYYNNCPFDSVAQSNLLKPQRELYIFASKYFLEKSNLIVNSKEKRKPINIQVDPFKNATPAEFPNKVEQKRGL